MLDFKNKEEKMYMQKFRGNKNDIKEYKNKLDDIKVIK